MYLLCCTGWRNIMTRWLPVWTRYNDSDSDVEDTQTDPTTTTRLLRVHLPNEEVRLMSLVTAIHSDLWACDPRYTCIYIHCVRQLLTFSSPLVSNDYTSKCSEPYWFNPPLLIVWHSGTLALSPERQSARMLKKLKGWVRPVWRWMLW